MSETMTSKTASGAAPAERVKSLPQRMTYDLIPEEAIERIHRASLRVLENTGVHLHSAKLCAELEAAGCVVDHEERRVRFPGQLVEEAMTKAPSGYLLAAREEAADVVIDGKNSWMCLDGCASDFLDPWTGQMRPSTLDDLIKTTRVADALPYQAIIWEPCAARDVPTYIQPLHELRAQLANTSKHIQQMTIIEADHADSAVEMMTIVAGGEQELRDRPLMSSFQCSLSPLVLDGGPAEASIIYAKAGLPGGWLAMPLMGATSPTTVAGTLVLQNAEVLAGMAMIQLLVPGAPTFYGVCSSAMDMNTGSLSLGYGPEELLFSFGSAQLARRYGVPSNLGVGGSGAKAADWQLGLHDALSTFTTYLVGADMMCSSGTLYGGRVFSWENMVLDSEMMSVIERVSERYSTAIDDLACDVIDAVGPGGTYLGEQHTLAHMRELWQTKFLSRSNWEDWEVLGRPDPKDVANTRAKEIYESHEPLPLPDGVDEQLDQVIKRYEDTHENWEL